MSQGIKQILSFFFLSFFFFLVKNKYYQLVADAVNGNNYKCDKYSCLSDKYSIKILYYKYACSFFFFSEIKCARYS